MKLSLLSRVDMYAVVAACLLVVRDMLGSEKSVGRERGGRKYRQRTKRKRWERKRERTQRVDCKNRQLEALNEREEKRGSKKKKGRGTGWMWFGL